MRYARGIALWIGLICAVGIPIFLAVQSPLLAWRDGIYILGGLAGVLAMAVMLIQPLIVNGDLPGLSVRLGRRIHRLTGILLLVAVLVHVGALWRTSPPDVIDALLFRSPTPFAVWGVIAMWAIFATGALAAMRPHLSLRLWRRAHTGLALVIIISTILHAVLIQGTMEPISKYVLGILVLVATHKVIVDLRVWARRKTR